MNVGGRECNTEPTWSFSKGCCPTRKIHIIFSDIMLAGADKCAACHWKDSTFPSDDNLRTISHSHKGASRGKSFQNMHGDWIHYTTA